MKEMFVKAKMKEDTVEPYKSWGKKIPFVTESTHPRFHLGKRLDWGFLQTAIDDGYTVTIEPFDVNKSNCKHENGFRRTCIICGGGKTQQREYRCDICHAARYTKENSTLPSKLPDMLPADYKWDDKDD